MPVRCKSQMHSAGVCFGMNLKCNDWQNRYQDVNSQPSFMFFTLLKSFTFKPPK